VSASIIGAGAVSAFGVGWRGLGRAVAGEKLPSQVPPFTPREDVDPRSRKLMSRSAHLAAVAMRDALRDAGLGDARERIGAYFGVGASGPSMEEAREMLARSLAGGRLDLARLGTDGIAAVNPLFSFQMLNNFTMCHGAIGEGIGGPNAVFFSRGAATGRALDEAIHALESGECEIALVGAADTALHPLTAAELRRRGLAVVPGEGAAVLVLAREVERPLAIVEACAPDTRAALVVVEGLEREGAVDVSRALGCTLAAGPALAWTVALDLLETDAVVLTRDVDGGTSAFSLRRPR